MCYSRVFRRVIFTNWHVLFTSISCLFVCRATPHARMTSNSHAGMTSNVAASLSSTPPSRPPAPEPPGRWQKFSQVDPDSSHGLPVTEAHTRDLLLEALAPMNKQLQDIQETQERNNEEAAHFHHCFGELKTCNETLNTTLSNTDSENKNLKPRLVMVESQTRCVNLRFYGIPETEQENPEDHSWVSFTSWVPSLPSCDRMCT